MDKEKNLRVIRILEINADAITIADVQNTPYEELINFLELFDKEIREEIQNRCVFNNRKPKWLSIQRNLNPKYATQRPIVWVWVTHFLKIIIKKIQEDAGIKE